MGYSVAVAPVGRANVFSSLGYYIPTKTTKRFNNCSNTLCFTYNHNYVYQPHSAIGRVGTTSASHMAIRKRV
jgi:hypothetical protein